jgi:hypothetical protein
LNSANISLFLQFIYFVANYKRYVGSRIRNFSNTTSFYEKQTTINFSITIFPSDLVGSSSVTSVNFTRDGQCIVVGLTSGEPVRLFDKSTGEMLQEYLGNKNESGYRIEAVLDHTDRRILAGKSFVCFSMKLIVFIKLESSLNQLNK